MRQAVQLGLVPAAQVGLDLNIWGSVQCTTIKAGPVTSHNEAAGMLQRKGDQRGGGGWGGGREGSLVMAQMSACRAVAVILLNHIWAHVVLLL